ncbi:MAG: ABC transporter ATP-binding protein [Candidatus Xenobia bacterium]
MALLELRDVESWYGNIRALHGISLSVEAHEIVTLIGANGAGKTTTLRTISGLLRPRQGEIKFGDLRIDTLPPHEIVRLGVAQSPEGRKIFARMTVQENLEMGAFLRRDKSAVEDDRRAVFKLFPRLEERLSQKGGTLSGGEQQMLAVARALMSRPKLLLLDEPSMGLAPLLVKDIFKAVVEVNLRGIPILLVEQNAHMALSIAHRAYVLETGRIVMEGPASQVATDDRVKAAYLGV